MEAFIFSIESGHDTSKVKILGPIFHSLTEICTMSKKRLQGHGNRSNGERNSILSTGFAVPLQDFFRRELKDISTKFNNELIQFLDISSKPNVFRTESLNASDLVHVTFRKDFLRGIESIGIDDDRGENHRANNGILEHMLAFFSQLLGYESHTRSNTVTNVSLRSSDWREESFVHVMIDNLYDSRLEMFDRLGHAVVIHEHQVERVGTHRSEFFHAPDFVNRNSKPVKDEESVLPQLDLVSGE
jgi:hypothetical protein